MPNPKKLLNRNFVLLWQGQFVSLIGSSAFSVAIMLWLKQITGSASIMGLVMTIIQQTTPDWIRGRVLGVLNTLVTGLLPLGMGLIGIATDLLGRNIPLMFIICCSLGLIVYIIFTFSPEYRYFLAYEPPREETSSS